MRSSTCFAYKHLTFIPYALANVVEDEGDFTVAKGHGHPLTWVRYRRTTGPGLALPTAVGVPGRVRHRRLTGPVRPTGLGPTLPAGQSPDVGGAELGPSQKADRARPGTPHGGRLIGPTLFGAWEILGYGFQDMVFRTWDLNFGAWIFTLAVSKTKS